MNTKTIVLAMVVVAAIAAIATAPTALNANADRGGEQPRDCFHKGTGDEIDCDDEKGNNANSCNKGGQQCRDD
jgi:hypothetical protein